MENPEAETMRSPVTSSLRPLWSHSDLFFFPSWHRVSEVWIQSGRHQIELDGRALIRAGDQLNGERINWIQARKPSPAVVWHRATASGKREERVKGEGGGKVYERERETCRKENSELVRIKVKEEGWGQDGDQTANEGPWNAVTQLDVYTETGRGSGYLNLKQATCLHWVNWL